MTTVSAMTCSSTKTSKPQMSYSTNETGREEAWQGTEPLEKDMSKRSPVHTGIPWRHCGSSPDTPRKPTLQ